MNIFLSIPFLIFMPLVISVLLLSPLFTRNEVVVRRFAKSVFGFHFLYMILMLAFFDSANPYFSEIHFCGQDWIQSLGIKFLFKMDNISIFNDDIKDFYKTLESDTYDVVVSNPPYFMGNIHNINEMKKIARHSLSLDYKDVIVISKKILKNNGLLSIVHRPENLMEILFTMRKNNIEPKKIRFVYPYKGKNANILLVEGMKNGKPGLKIMDPLYVYENCEYTEEIKNYFS